MTELRPRIRFLGPAAFGVAATMLTAGVLMSSTRAPTASVATVQAPAVVWARAGTQTAPVAAQQNAGGRSAPLIVIDPGHSGRSIRSTVRNHLRDIDYPNYPEIYEVFDISRCVASALRSDGYRVLLTKKHALSSVGLAARARIATGAKAALAVSVHDDHGVGPSFEATYSQRGVKHHGRYHAMYRGRGSHRTVFRHPSVAKTSERYAEIIARARSKAQHHQVRVTENVYTGRPPLEPGNLGLVQLLSGVPWVYNEMGALTRHRVGRAMRISTETRYAKGLLAGIESAVPVVAGHRNPYTGSSTHLERCLTHRVEPRRGHLTRPRAYLPYQFVYKP